MKTKEIRFTLRIDKSLHAEIARMAKRENRSVNAQIVHLIQEHLRTRKGADL
jgi:hypothetical protein